MKKVNERTIGRPHRVLIICLCLVVAMGMETQVQGQEVVSHPPKNASNQIPVFSARPNDSSSQCKTCAKDSESDLRTDFNRMLHAPAAIPSGVRRNYRWLLPASAITAALIATGADERASRHVDSSSLERTSNNLSHVGLYGIGLGSAATIFALGCHHGPNCDPHRRRAGFRTLEAMGYGLVIDEGLKAAFNRERPDNPAGDGRFWHGGKSFPSGHAVAIWAFASAISHEYPNNRMVRYGSYGLAIAVSGLRFSAKKHFPSDVLGGSVVGYSLGKYLGQ
jgi:membrane-associated phospholipid phosphatase